jgi:hypothetical protein
MSTVIARRILLQGAYRRSRGASESGAGYRSQGGV